jgi:DNA-binding beta-propeller fold protein YncE
MLVTATVTMLASVSPSNAIASCEGECTPEQEESGLVEPPEWAQESHAHFEPESAEASAYSEEEPFGEGEGEGGPLLYHESGKGVQHAPKVYLIFWGSNFTTGEAGKEVHSMLLNLFEGLSGTSYQEILTQYFDSTGRVSSIITATSYIDESVIAPSVVNHLRVEEEVTRVVNENGWKPEIDAQFMVLSAPGSTYEKIFMFGACAYHGVTAAKEKVTGGIVYGFVPYQGDSRFEGCVGVGNPSKNPVFKTSKSVSHEYTEAATDPIPGEGTQAWAASSGAEIADICSKLDDFELASGAYAQWQYDDHLNSCGESDAEPPHAYAITEAVSNIKATEVTLKGVVNPEGLESNYYFEYGTTKSYGVKSAETSGGSGVKNQSVSKVVGSLTPSTTYHYRIVEINSSGMTTGEDHTFTTEKGPPTVVTESATGVTTTEVILHGTVNPNGFATTDQFEYGTSTSYGTNVPASSESAGSGFSTLAKGYVLTGLLPSKTYHFRFVASNAQGTSSGKDVAFTTKSLTPTFSSNFGSTGSGEGQFVEPTGIAVNPVNGKLVVPDEGNNRVEVFNEEGKYLSQFGAKGGENGQFTQPRGAAVDASGNVWIVDTGNNRVQKFNEEGKYLSQFGSGGTGNGQFSSPKGLAVDQKGNIWVADSGNKRIQKFNEAGEYVCQFSAGTNPIGVAADSKGNVWSDNLNLKGAIEEHNESCERIQSFAAFGTGNGKLLEPKRLAVDSNGYIWVPDAGNNRVEVFTEKGEYVTKFGTKGSGSEQMKSPVGLALDSKGNVWIDDNNSRMDHWVR